MRAAEYGCRTCNKFYSLEQYDKSRFCPDCGTYLTPRIKIPSDPVIRIKNPRTVIEPIESSGEVNLGTIFAEFNRLTDFECGEGIQLKNTFEWVVERKRAYSVFREKLGTGRLVSYDQLSDDFKDFLHFKHNYSWTTLYRTGLKAASDPEKLWETLTFIQDENIDIKKRINLSLAGRYHINGIGKNIVTALLHTFYPEKYCVWNSRSEEALKLIRRRIPEIHNLGSKYLALNKEMTKLSKELNTDLTTTDGLMWYISKRLKPQLLK